MSAIPLRTLIRPAVRHLSYAYGASGGAAPEVMMGAIGLQESAFEARDQLEIQNGRLVAGAVGPACGFWQFERGGGVTGVMRHPASRRAAMELCAAAGVPFEADAIWRSFATIEGDELAAAFARLLLLTDPRPLPGAVLASEEEAFGYYLRNWRPGAWFNSAPDSEARRQLRAKWGRNWPAAVAAVQANPSEDDGVVEAPIVAPVPALPVEQRVALLEQRVAALEAA